MMNQHKQKSKRPTAASFDVKPVASVTSQEKKAAHQKPFEYWLKKNWYYHKQLINFYRFVIPEGAAVVHINGNNGYLLDAIKPLQGVGIEADESILIAARQQHPAYKFYSSLTDISSHHTFDYIILSLVTMESDDIQELFQHVQTYAH